MRQIGAEGFSESLAVGQVGESELVRTHRSAELL